MDCIIYVANPYSYEIGKEYTVYTYQNITESENSLYGFKSMDEKELFLRLIAVKGLGPKTALPMFASGSVSGIIDAIDRENILYFLKLYDYLLNILRSLLCIRTLFITTPIIT